MSSAFKVDVKDLQRVLNDLTGTQLDRIQRGALRAGGQLVLKEARSQLLRAVPKAKKRSNFFSDTLLDAVRMSVNHDYGEHTYYFKVHIMGSRSKSSGTFRTRFFEGGTIPRKTKAPYRDSLGRSYPAGQNRGRLRATNFFDNAYQATNSQVIHVMQQRFDELFEKYVK